MEQKFVVFWLDTQREIYGDDPYYVLGQRMATCDTQKEAIKFIAQLSLKPHQECTILPVYSGK